VPNVLDAVAINVVIVGLRASQFRSHLMRKRPRTIQRFEKYCRSDVYGRALSAEKVRES
jgi:xanthosine utilization system XapX-like protein